MLTNFLQLLGPIRETKSLPASVQVLDNLERFEVVHTHYRVLKRLRLYLHIHSLRTTFHTLHVFFNRSQFGTTTETRGTCGNMVWACCRQMGTIK
jgi:hypothetical protein